MELGLDQKTVLVTGASGGIGRAIVRVFAEESARVVCHVHRNRDSLEAWIAAQPWRDRATIVEADVRDADACAAMMRDATADGHPLDACVVNAGIWGAESIPLADMPEARIRRVLDVNLFGAIWTARAFLATLRETGVADASLTFVGSTAGRFGEAGNAEYAASKAAMYGLVRSLKNEMPRIEPTARVNLVEPGWTRTDMTAATLDDDATVERVVRTMPLRQIADADDIARTVVWLSSPIAARHITGEVVTVAGGMEGRQLWHADEVDAPSVHARRAPGANDGDAG